MEKVKENQRLESWIEKQLSIGKFGFSLDTLRQTFHEQSDTAIKFALKRLVDKGKIISIYKGYYLIIPAQYLNRGILPPNMFLDAFMNFLKRPYYAALLNAATFHEASNQQPQEYFVITNFPVLRTTQKKGIKINYLSVKTIPENFIEKRKTETGYLNISKPFLTATDLVKFEKRVGGINRVAAVLNELCEVIKPDDFNDEIVEFVPVTVLQRLGCILDKVLGNKELADVLFQILERAGVQLFRIPLKASLPIKGFSSDERWKVIINTEIELDV
jgi:predicted transcriptional regulator of viral defense system